MNKEVYIQAIKKECAFLEEEGYTFNQLETNVFYTKNLPEEGYRIGFSWLEYGDKFVTQGLSARKRFNIVEREIQKVLGGELENYYTIHKSPPIGVDYIPKELDYKIQGENFRVVTNSIKDIELFGEFVKSFYQLDVVTFFNSNKEFIDTVRVYEKLEREKVSTIIINTGTDIFYRELVIKNKSKASDENDFAQMVITELEPMKANSTFGKIIENIKLLQKNLHLSE